MTKKKGIIIAVALLLALAVFAGTVTAFFVFGAGKSTDKRYAVEDGAGNGFEPGEVHELPSKLVFNADTLTSGGVNASATFRVSLDPVYSTDKRLDWSASWVNPSSEWANGKEVAAYVGITQDAKALTGTVQCLQPFGEKIRLTVKPLSNPEVSASCVMDYRKRLVSMTNKFFTVNVPDQTEADLKLFAISTLDKRNLTEVFLEGLEYHYCDGTLPARMQTEGVVGCPEGVGTYVPTGAITVDPYVIPTPDVTMRFTEFDRRIGNVPWLELWTSGFEEFCTQNFYLRNSTAAEELLSLQNKYSCSEKGLLVTSFSLTLWGERVEFRTLLYFTDLERPVVGLTVDQSTVELDGYVSPAA